MEQKRIKVRLTENSPYSDYGYYEKGDIGYIDGYVNNNAVIILENGKFAKADLRCIEVVNEEDKMFHGIKDEDERIRKEIIDLIEEVGEDDIRKAMGEGLEKMNPLVKNVTKELMDAYELGFLTCFQLLTGEEV